MANKALSPKEFLAVVEFYNALHLMHDRVFEGTNTTRNALTRSLLMLLGYVIIEGKYVDKDRYAATSYRYGTRPVFKDELVADIEEALNEITDGDTHRTEADSGKPAPDTPVWKAVLRKDV